MSFEQEIPADVIESGPRRRRPIRGAGTKAYRAAVTIEGLKATLAQETTLADQARLLRPLIRAVIRLKAARIGRRYTREVGERIDEVLSALATVRDRADEYERKLPPVRPPLAPNLDIFAERWLESEPGEWRWLNR